jgi:predicted DsbA family dithiol-disulfide isomerase
MREYARAIRDRYWQNSKVGKTKILDEFTKTTGLHRKAAVRLLNKETSKHRNKKSGRPRKYSHEAIEVLKTVWEAL